MRLPEIEAALAQDAHAGRGVEVTIETVRRDAHTHPHPEAGGLVLCGPCAAKVREEGKASRPLTHAEMVPWWSDRISVAMPRFCDACCEPVVASDTPEV